MKVLETTLGNLIDNLDWHYLSLLAEALRVLDHRINRCVNVLEMQIILQALCNFCRKICYLSERYYVILFLIFHDISTLNQAANTFLTLAKFQRTINPSANSFGYKDYLGNMK